MRTIQDPIWSSAGSKEDREGEAPAEPCRHTLLIQKGAAEASPFRNKHRQFSKGGTHEKQCTVPTCTPFRGAPCSLHCYSM